MAHGIYAPNTKIYLAHYDISGHLNAHTIGRSVDLPDDTTYGDTFKQRMIGLQHTNFSVAGFVDLAGTTDTDTVITSQMGAADKTLIICPNGATSGEAAEFGLIAQGQYTPSLKVGESYTFSLTGELSSQRWVRGKVLANASASGTGFLNATGVELGAVSATQRVWAIIVVYAENMTNLEAVLYSDDNSGLSSATSRISFTATGVVGSEMKSLAGAITDTHWQISINNFTGTSYSLLAVAGIADATNV